MIPGLASAVKGLYNLAERGYCLVAARKPPERGSSMYGPVVKARAEVVEKYRGRYGTGIMFIFMVRANAYLRGARPDGLERFIRGAMVGN
jgi:hypothetical protein